MRGPMSDPTLARAFAGPSFRRADSERDERAAERPRLVEDFLRGLRGWLPPGRESLRSIARFNAAVQAVALALRAADDAAIADRLRLEMRGLKASSARLHRDPRLAAIFACIGEASRRRLGLWPHPVQFTGARVLLGGCLAEMQTGEGKTLVAGARRDGDGGVRARRSTSSAPTTISHRATAPRCGRCSSSSA